MSLKDETIAKLEEVRFVGITKSGVIEFLKIISETSNLIMKARQFLLWINQAMLKKRDPRRPTVLKGKLWHVSLFQPLNC